MFEFMPENLFLQLDDEEKYSDFLPRKYTLTHSDETGEMFLSVGKDYNYNKSGDVVLGEWQLNGGNYILKIHIEVDGGTGLTQTVNRDKIFREKLPLALKAIVYGDRKFLNEQQMLMEAPVIVNFKSAIPEYNKEENWGMLKQYSYEDIEKPQGDENDLEIEEIENELMQSRLFSSHFRQEPEVETKYFPGLPLKPQPPRPPRPQPGRNSIIEKSLINTLSPYIKSEVYVAFGRNAYYCLTDAEVLRVRTIRTYGPCSEEYEVEVGLRVGRRPPRDNNIRITFIINENVIRVRNVESPRPRPRE